MFHDGHTSVLTREQHSWLTVLHQWSGSWQGFFLAVISSDWQPHNGGQARALSVQAKGEGTRASPQSANLTNGRLRLFSHQPKRLQEGPEKWHRRGDYLPGPGWKDILRDEKIRADLRKGQKEDWSSRGGGWGGANPRSVASFSLEEM